MCLYIYSFHAYFFIVSTRVETSCHIYNDNNNKNDNNKNDNNNYKDKKYLFIPCLLNLYLVFPLPI